jgi:hypothetical protein
MRPDKFHGKSKYFIEPCPYISSRQANTIPMYREKCSKLRFGVFISECKWYPNLDICWEEWEIEKKGVNDD